MPKMGEALAYKQLAALDESSFPRLDKLHSKYWI